MRRLSQYYTYKIAGKEYKLRFKTPTIGEQIAIGQEIAVLKAGFKSLDDVSETLAIATATLNSVIDNKPTDLDFENMFTDDWAEVTRMLQDYKRFAFFRSESSAEPTEA